MKWKKIGQIFDPTTYNDGVTRDWMKTHAQCPSTLVLDDVVRVYFSCRPEKDADGQATSFTTFLELDKKELTQIVRVAENPVLPLGSLGSFDEFAVYPTSVIAYNGLVYLYYAGWNRMKSVPFNTAIGVAVSHDGGETFERIAPGPIVSASAYEPYVLSGPKVRRFNDTWYLFYLSGVAWKKHNGLPEIVYKNRMALSEDGLNWKPLNRNILPDVLDENECQAGPDVFFYNDKYHMYFAYRHGFDFRESLGRGYKIGYAYSDDLMHWHRNDALAGIGYSPSGWDATMQHYPHVFQVEKTWYMLYNGNEFGKYGLGLAQGYED